MKYNLRILLLVIPIVNALAQAPDNYYDGTDDLTGNELKLKLHQIIRDHTVRGYSEFRDTILPDLDEDPDNSENLIVFYKNASVPKSDFAVDDDSWNREHTWPSSHGFPEISDTTYTDAHNLRPSDASVNTSKSNKDFENVENVEDNAEGEAPDTYTDDDFWDPRDEIKGDVARILFYMDTRYESDRLDLKIVDRESFSGDPEIGVLSTLIEWHEQDPVDDYERERHEGIFSYQNNRNPFIDHPEWVAEIFGSTTDPYLVVDELSFSRDFGFVELGSTFKQQYSINAYNLSDDVSVLVEEPFYVSTDGLNWTDSIGFSNDASGSQTWTIHLQYEPLVADETEEAEVLHYTEGDTVRFDVSGSEGALESISIFEARQMDLEEVVNVSGVVIDEGNNSTSSRVIYDGTAGIVVRSFDAGNESEFFVLGDSISVIGGLGDYNGLLQISESPISINLLKSNANLPNPQIHLISDVGEEDESELITIENVRFKDAGGIFQGGGSSGNFVIVDEEDEELILRIGSSDHPLVGTTIPEGIYSITGFVGQFGDDYQLSPRSEDDIVFISDGKPTLSIAEARAQSIGLEVKVTGVVISAGNNSNDNRVIYDGTAGIVVRSFDEGNESAPLVLGDSIEVIGGLSSYQSTLQIEESPITIELLKQDVALPIPQQIDASDISEEYESELVEISGLSFIVSGEFDRGEYILSDGESELILKVGLAGHPLVGTDIPSGTVTITGFIEQDEEDYKLLPRLVSDIVVTSGPLSVEKANAHWSLYPNPAKDYLVINLPGNLVNRNFDGTIVNLQGQTVMAFENAEMPLRVNELARGLYIILIELKGKVVYKEKFLKK